MFEGLWTVQFQGVQGGGGGVVVFTKGKVLGGDGGYTYVGEYEENGNNVKARVTVSNFIPGVANVMGRQGNFDLEFAGVGNGDTMNVTANLVGTPTQRLNARLTKKTSLP
jgi:hypothetical protein